MGEMEERREEEEEALEFGERKDGKILTGVSRTATSWGKVRVRPPLWFSLLLPAMELGRESGVFEAVCVDRLRAEEAMRGNER